MIPNGGEAFGGQVPQIVGLRRGPERAYPSVGERGPQKQRREMGCMGAEGPSSFGITHLAVREALDGLRDAVLAVRVGLVVLLAGVLETGGNLPPRPVH